MVTHRRIFEVSWPYTLSISTAFLLQTLDSTMVAPLGTSALAALAVSGSTCFIPNAITMGLITAIQKRVASSEDKRKFDGAISSGLVLGILLGLPFALIFFFLSHQIASLYTSGQTRELAATFLRIFSPALLFQALNFSMNGYWIGILKTKTRLYITLIQAVINVIGNLLLIPRLGFPSVAISSTFAIFCGVLINFYLLRKDGFRWETPNLRRIVADFKLVIGVALNQLSLALALNAAIFVVGIIGVDALAVANIVGTLSLPGLLLGIGYGTSTGSFIIKFMANGDVEEARRTSLRTLTQVFFVCLLFAAGILMFSTPIRHWFFREAGPFELSRAPFFILAFLYMIDAVSCTLQRFHFVTKGLLLNFSTMAIVQWLLFIPGAYIGVKFFHIGYTTYLTFHLLQRLLIAGVLFYAWKLRVQAPRVITEISP